MQICKSILITGGTGSLGTEFVKRMRELNVSRICVFSRGEHKQAKMREELGYDPRLRWFIGDVRDRDRLYEAMEDVECVLHTAALKRVDTCELNPFEAESINIGGAKNVIKAAKNAGVKKVVGVSTDKAFAPVNIYGSTKFTAERLFLDGNNMAGAYGPKYSVVRYGNVWKSAGSFVPLWQAMLASGARAVPITDPECTRFFMPVRQAVDFVCDTFGEMPREVNIPDLPAYRIGDVADAMGAEQNVIGLPVNEKLHESMCEGRSSDKARRMSVEEIRSHL